MTDKEFVEIKYVFVVVEVTSNMYMNIVHVFMTESKAKKFTNDMNKTTKKDNADYPQFATEKKYFYYKVEVKDDTIGYLKMTGQL
jgi:hypothetical protein